MIITIDGPTASGKSTVAHLLAQKLGYWYINSGLLFRAVAYVLNKEKLDLRHRPTLDKLESLLGHKEGIEYIYAQNTGAQIWYKGVQITPYLKTPAIDTLASQCAINHTIRNLLLTYQQKIAKGQDIVAEGRDTGTVVFPQAKVKLYITAALNVRAQRWQTDQQRKGHIYTLAESEQLISERDARDEQRAIAPLIMPENASIIDTSFSTIEEVVDECMRILKNR